MQVHFPAPIAGLLLLGAPALALAQGPVLTQGYAPPAEVHSPLTIDVATPPDAFTRQVPAHKQGLPAIPLGTGTLPQPQGGPVQVAATHPAAPCDVTMFQSQSVRPAGATRSVVGEPSVAQVGDTIFQVGNWYAARSIDQGMTWTYINPYTLFAAPDGTFCCDQRTLYVPSHDIVVWILQYQYSATTQNGGVRIAVANGRSDLRAGTTGRWHSWYLRPANFNLRATGEWLDFPDIATSNTRLYFTSNVFNANNTYTDSVWARFQLTELAATGGLNFGFGSVTGGQFQGHSFRLAQYGTDTSYFANHVDTTTLRVYRIPDTSSGVPSSLVTVPAWTNGPYVALAPNGVNWAGRHDARVLGGYQNATEYGFLWVSAPQTSRPHCFVRAARIRKSDHTLIVAEDVFNNTVPVLYPGATTNLRGDIGCTIAIGDFANRHPTTAYFIVDSCFASFFGQAATLFGGVASPTAPQWGDYVSLQRHPNLPQTFVSGGQRLLTATDVDARLVWFGRESEQPATINLFVDSTPIAGVTLTVDETDRAGRKDGITNTTRQFFPEQGYTLRVPATFTSGGVLYALDRWRWRSSPTSAYVDQPTGQTALTVGSIGATDDNALAVYARVRTLSVLSSNPSSGIVVSASVADIGGTTSVTTPGTLSYREGQTTVLTAPASNGTRPFRRWTLDGTPGPDGQRTLTVAMNAARTATAEFAVLTPGNFRTFGTGCPGTGGAVPAHTATGTPEIGQQITYRVARARPVASASLLFGDSNTNWVGIPLPVNLGFLGMGTCTLFAEAEVQFGVLIDGAGSGALTLQLPNDPTVIGTHRYTQFLIFDPGTATPTQLVLSDAIDTTIGGVQ